MQQHMGWVIFLNIMFGMTWKKDENSACRDYKYYGGRGINVHPDWFDFTKFFHDMGPRPTNLHTIDRIDTNGNYEPGNVVWATMSEQNKTHRVQCNNKVGIRGICFRGDRYRVRISCGGRRIILGTVDSLEEAKLLRIEGEIKYWGKQITIWWTRKLKF